MRMSVALLALFTAFSAPAYAGAPSDAVRFFYDNLGAEFDLQHRDRFAGPALGFLNAADAAWVRDETNCIEFGFAADAQDFDAAEIAKTLELDETVDGEVATVAAHFDNFGQPTEVQWTLSHNAAGWQVSDIASRTNDWRVSAMSCQ
ncbi:hypothetical protein PZ897_01080 [Hoeflea sp. YIM 152468]|uniref:hypothetical protein n=1 Tax=Hoeflea sp. YIM 152468 TaxID=3031759 RepID=UPI0023DB97F4|nr:hypothetical protein [Hoeflea sp. YIM 152468]MDF1606761.1 hypothetical protein [Hoeflea sp. YIM 152468]